MEQVLLVMTNLPDLQSAKALARALVEARLAACVNILPGVQSLYRWQGQIEEAVEFTLHIKTTQGRYQQVQHAILAVHPYTLPEIIVIPVSAGHAPYLYWVASETAQDSHV